jgi:hypothetical protein
MNVRLQHSYSFLAAAYLPMHGVIFNEYHLSLNMVTNTTSSIEQNIAFDRVCYYVDELLNNSVFVQSSETEACRLLNTAGLKIITLPEVPYDQIIGLALFTKLNAIMEGRLVITDSDIFSARGKNVIYLHSSDEATGPFENSGWWNTPDLSHCDKVIPTENRKIVRLVTKEPTWRHLNLDWEAGYEPEDSDEPKTSVVVKFGDEE